MKKQRGRTEDNCMIPQNAYILILLVPVIVFCVWVLHQQNKIITDLREELQRRTIELSNMGEWQKSTIKSLVQARLNTHIPYGTKSHACWTVLQAYCELKQAERHQQIWLYYSICRTISKGEEKCLRALQRSLESITRPTYALRAPKTVLLPSLPVAMRLRQDEVGLQR